MAEETMKDFEQEITESFKNKKQVFINYAISCDVYNL